MSGYESTSKATSSSLMYCNHLSRRLVRGFPRHKLLGTTIKVQNFHLTSFLNGRNEPKFDEAEIMAEKLNHDSYVGKRNKLDFQWEDKPDAEREKEYADRMEKMAKLNAVFQGLAILAGVCTLGTAYLNWPQIKNWWTTKDIRVDDMTIEELKKKKERKKLMEIPTVPADCPDSSVPGLYYWGQRLGLESRKGVSKVPLRVPHFDNMELRDVALSDSVKYGNLAIDKNGDLLEWDMKECSPILKDQNLVKVLISNEVAYTLNKRGEILVIPLTDRNIFQKNINWKRSKLIPWKKYCSYSWKLNAKPKFSLSGESKISDFSVGAKHLVMLSNKGQAYACATGLKIDEDARSKGQLGIPTFSQFDPYPSLNEVYEIELLNKAMVGDRVTSRNIVKVACGDYHTMAIDSIGELYSFGLNRYGQLGQPISYDMEIIPFPRKVNNFAAHFGKNDFLKCIDVHCCGDTSYATILPQDVNRYFRDGKKEDKTDRNITYFAFGNGIQGQLGNGHFKHSQSEPTKMKVVNNDSSRKLASNSEIQEWSCGNEHVFVKLKSGEVLTWGFNEFGQLGNWKKIKWDKPSHIPKLLEPGVKVNNKDIEQLYNEDNALKLADNQTLRAGSNASCLFWKAK